MKPIVEDMDTNNHQPEAIDKLVEGQERAGFIECYGNW